MCKILNVLIERSYFKDNRSNIDFIGENDFLKAISVRSVQPIWTQMIFFQSYLLSEWEYWSVAAWSKSKAGAGFNLTSIWIWVLTMSFLNPGCTMVGVLILLQSGYGFWPIITKMYGLLLRVCLNPTSIWIWVLTRQRISHGKYVWVLILLQSGYGFWLSTDYLT